MKKRTYVAIALTLCICLLNSLLMFVPVSADNGFETNLTGWTPADNTTWTLDENGYSNGKYPEDADTENYKHLAASDKVVDGTKSFTYEVTFKITDDGYGAGLALSTTDRDNFYAVEVNREGSFYFPTVNNGSWSTWNAYGNDLTDDQKNLEYKTILFDYNASTKGAKVYLNDTLMAEVTYVASSVFGRLGLYYEDAEVVFTKAVYTEKDSSGEKQESVFETNMGDWTAVDGFEWADTSKGYGCVNDVGNKHLAASSIDIDATQSFEYEVTFMYNGYGAGLAFGAVDTGNLAAVEINVEGKLYFPVIIDGAWSTFYDYGKALTEEQMDQTKPHTLLFRYDAVEEYAEVYLDGELMQELFFFDVTLLYGKLGLYNEGTEAFYTKAVYTELEMPTPTPTPDATPTPDVTEAPATQAPTQDPSETTAPTATNEGNSGTDKSDGNEDGVSPILIAVVIVLACVVVAVGIMLVIKSKKK